MKLKLSIIYLSLLPLAISFSCSTSNPTAKNSTSTNITVENRLANKDFSNKPVNLNNQKDKEKCDKQIEELNKSRDLWKEQNISDYDFVCEAFNPSMIVFSPVLIKVRGNQTVSVEETFQSDVYKHFS